MSNLVLFWVAFLGAQWRVIMKTLGSPKARTRPSQDQKDHRPCFDEICIEAVVSEKGQAMHMGLEKFFKVFGK